MNDQHTRTTQLLFAPEQEGDFVADAATGVSATVPGPAGPVVQTPRPAESMAESVTRHAQNPTFGPDEFRHLLCGIDTLDLGLYVRWDKTWAKRLTYFQEKKESSFGNNGYTDETVHGRKFLHHPSGKAPNYRFHLQFPEYHLYLSTRQEPSTKAPSPTVYASLSAETLWQFGISMSIEMLIMDLETFGGTVEKIQPSRCDICADFLIPVGLTFEFLRTHQVSRSKAVAPVLNDNRLETYYCGSKSAPIQLRIYDKSKEVLKRGTKLWFFPLWGVDQYAHVWRVEFQLRRPILKQFGINTVDHLWEKLGGVWGYLTEEWFSLRLPDDDKTERRTMHPWWLDVQSIKDQLGPAITVQRTFTGTTPASIEWLLSHISGCITSCAARLGIPDRKQVIAELSTQIEKACPDSKFQQEFVKRSIKLGKDPDMCGVTYEE